MKTLVIIISAVMLLFGLFIWPTPYEVEIYKVGTYPSAIKVNRFCGKIVSIKLGMNEYDNEYLKMLKMLKEKVSKNKEKLD